MFLPRVRCSASATLVRRANSNFREFSPVKWLTLTSVSVLAVGAQMHAQTAQIDTETSTPVQTSTADNGSPADVEITSDGSVAIEQTDGVVAVTVDSDNALINDGSIEIDDSDNAIGILIEANRTGDISGSGTISLLEDYTREDDDDDEDLDGPLAIGSNRTAILLQSGGTHSGNLTIDAGGVIAVEGNDSLGIDLQSTLDGALTLDGTISVLGDNARGIRAADAITGDVLISGTVNARGENAQAIEFDGDLGGALTFESLVSSSGFVSTSVTNYLAPTAIDEDTPAIADRIDAEDLMDNSGAVAVRGSVAKGILINGNVDTFTSEEDQEDETKDTLDDFDENRSSGTISSIGSGTALLIAAEDSDLVIGTVVETVRDTLDDDEDDDVTETLATFNYAQGLINRGTISANGLNIGYDALALRIEGAADGSARAIISGGIDNGGTIQANAYNANATAASFGLGADIGELANSGNITAVTRAVATETATALLIEDGAVLTTLSNDQGSITANTVGVSGSAVAIRDLGGTLTTLENQGLISATLTSDGTETEETGQAIAIDLSSHDASTGATLIQQRATPVDDINGDDVVDSNDVDTPAIVGDVFFGAGDDRFDLLAGSVLGDVDFAAGDADFKLTNSTLTGDTAFADGSHSFDASGADVAGTLTFQNATASISFANGSTFIGSIQSDGSIVDMQVASSDLTFDAGNRTALNTLSVSGETSLIFTIDPYDTEGAVLQVDGAADLGADVTIAPVLESIARDPFSQVLISADALTFGGIFDDSQVTSVPFLYNLNLTQSDTELELFFDLKTAEELDFDDNQARAYDPLLDIFVTDETLGAAIALIDDEATFHQTYDLLLPQRTNASQQFLSTQWSAAYGALDDHLSLLGWSDRDQIGLWAQEFYYNLDEDTGVQNPGYNGNGFGFAAGFDRTFGPIDRAGIMVSYVSGSFEEKTGGYNPISTSSTGLGVYAMQGLGPINLRVAGQLAKVDFTSNRDYDIDELAYRIDGDWSGLSQSLSVVAVSEFDLGWVYTRSEVSADWLSLSQDGYTESGFASTDGLFAEVSDVDTDELGVTANLVLGKQLEMGGGIMRVEASGGYRSIASSTPYSATVSFAGTDQAFDLIAPESDSGAALFGLSLAGDGELLSSKIGYDMKLTDDSLSHVFGGTIRLKF